MLAHGLGSSRRWSRQGRSLRTAAAYADGRWHVVFQRTLRPSVELSGQVGFAPSHALGLAIAIWGGSNRERAGQKSISGEWESLEVAA
ncbi:MAG: ethylbenzene dehydrogenase-related protein [Gammaproteobacteria bacterium]|nr:ethylbenzene dehydrogenase-related protein [Gammaproteobacteria bacterium]